MIPMIVGITRSRQMSGITNVNDTTDDSSFAQNTNRLYFLLHVLEVYTSHDLYATYALLRNAL
ncbi:hypothetical protein N7481_012527 [Penicillium waksmanii]|uniref:uncharacterized protein n=1 Tax=Penicillium waksmanii TaxID=69791 RepID=UPI0025496CD3|nr:uncharacterized protein N7481_012527 [Penicillium waksmanii]KAJ5965813.1 hypothetical protein N7481_012527 [Penicillium waksmanii]